MDFQTFLNREWPIFMFGAILTLFWPFFGFLKPKTKKWLKMAQNGLKWPQMKIITPLKL